VPVISSDDAARALLVAKADKWFWGLIWSTVTLLVGCLMEEIHPLNRLHTHNVNTRTRVRSARIWVIRSKWLYAKFAVLLVIGGIAGEGFCEFFGAKAESAVRNFDNGVAIRAGAAAKSAADDAKDAQDAASDAQDSADAANKDVDVVAKQTDALTLRLNKASEKIGALEDQVRIQGPRWKVLDDNRGDFINALKSFAPQKVTILQCGPWGSKGTEPTEMFNVLSGFLTKGNKSGWGDGAGWTTNGATWNSCGEEGILIITSSLASDDVNRAANALEDALNKLKISTDKMLEDPRNALYFKTSTDPRIVDMGFPWELAADDPSAVIVIVGTNPMYDKWAWSLRAQKRNHAHQK
jgi:hypothetical protein